MIEFLKNAFGEAVTDGIISEFKSELGKKFVAKSDYNAKRDELKNIQTEFENAKLKLNEADGLSKQLSALQLKYDTDISELNGRLKQVHFDNEVSTAIRKHGGKNEKAVKALMDLSDDDAVSNIEQQLDAIKLSDPYLFETPAPGGTNGNFPRDNSAKGAPLTYSQMLANMQK